MGRAAGRRHDARARVQLYGRTDQVRGHCPLKFTLRRRMAISFISSAIKTSDIKQLHTFSVLIPAIISRSMSHPITSALLVGVLKRMA